MKTIIDYFSEVANKKVCQLTIFMIKLDICQKSCQNASLYLTIYFIGILIC